MSYQLQRSEHLAEYIRELGDQFKIYEDIDGNYGHIGATIADAILQANRDYEKIVRPRVDAIREKYAKYTTTTALDELLNSITICQFLNYKGKDRLVGFPTAAPDIHLTDFLEEASIPYRNYDDAKDIINNCADILQVDRGHLDHSIWQYRRKKRSRNKARSCVVMAPIIS
jgi:hypothetical protein